MLAPGVTMYILTILICISNLRGYVNPEPGSASVLLRRQRRRFTANLPAHAMEGQSVYSMTVKWRLGGVELCRVGG